MSSITSRSDDPAKIITIGESGTAKTGSLMSLIGAGQKLRMIDTDNGARTMRGLMHPNYPYKQYFLDQNIDLDEAVSIIPIATNMGMRTITTPIPGPGNQKRVEKLLAPKDAKAWDRIITQLESWKDPDTKKDFGSFLTWGQDTTLIFDSFTTISRQSYYFNQELNGRLGAREDGFTHQKDVGGAQSHLRRLLEMIYDPSVKCNIVLICHINRIDDSRGFNQTPEQIRLADPSAVIEAKGFPMSVGLALSKRVGIYFCDSFVYRQSGSGMATTRKICTTPTTIDGVNVGTKTSTFLDREYDISTGLAQIFSALRDTPLPPDLIERLGTKKPEAPSTPAPGAKPY